MVLAALLIQQAAVDQVVAVEPQAPPAAAAAHTAEAAAEVLTPLTGLRVMARVVQCGLFGVQDVRSLQPTQEMFRGIICKLRLHTFGM